MNGLDAMETEGLFIFLENKRFFSCQILRSFNVIPASLEVNLPSLHDCQNQMIAMIIVTGYIISLAILT